MMLRSLLPLTRVRCCVRPRVAALACAGRRALSTATRLQYVSFYNYTPIAEDHLPRLRRELHDVWSELRVLGRIYIATEGINAQLILPASNLEAFESAVPGLYGREHLNLGATYDAVDAKDAFVVDGVELFEKLDIRIRRQIVADGFERGHLDLQDSGNALPPDQWHQKLRQCLKSTASSSTNADADADTGAGAQPIHTPTADNTNTSTNSNKNDLLLLDVRNFYEHEVGRFEGATRIMVDTFRDTFDAVDEILAKHEAEHDGEKPREVMMYCTGGIRCEKVGAYLKQYKGIDTIHKLQGGIVNYQRFLKAHPEEPSLFKGKNFVFDQRCVAGAVGGAGAESEVLTEDVLGTCFQCGEPCNDHTNCSNLMCHGLILQCKNCASQFLGACSEACREQVVKMQVMTPEDARAYRKENALRWRASNPNAVAPPDMKYVKFRPVPPEQRLASESQ
ncbi:hypothetical protein PINS_up000456 [Pythium insidiosum]|nr:hypothetical protein PINS_up000456 [Pythium insidiosum]